MIIEYKEITNDTSEEKLDSGFSSFFRKIQRMRMVKINRNISNEGVIARAGRNSAAVISAFLLRITFSKLRMIKTRLEKGEIFFRNAVQSEIILTRIVALRSKGLRLNLAFSLKFKSLVFGMRQIYNNAFTSEGYFDC